MQNILKFDISSEFGYNGLVFSIKVGLLEGMDRKGRKEKYRKTKNKMLKRKTSNGKRAKRKISKEKR